MIILKIILFLIIWLVIGIATQYLNYLRRKMTGLPTNFTDRWQRMSDKKLELQPFDMVDGKYICVSNRECPNKIGDIYQSKYVMLFGGISFCLWLIGFLIFILCPIVWYSIINGLYYLNHKVFGNKLTRIDIKKDVLNVDKDLEEHEMIF